MRTPLLAGHRCLIVDRLRLQCRIGILEHEQRRPQEVVVSLRVHIPETGRATSTEIADYVSYADIVDRLRALAGSDRHIPLVENLAEEIADLVLADARVARVVVDVRKTEIVPGCAGVGVVVERGRDGG